MLRIIGAFVVGVYVGQEYGNQIPSVKTKAVEMVTLFKESDLYKAIEKMEKRKGG